MRRLLSIALFSLAAFSQPQANQPKAVPFRSADGKVTGWKVQIPGNRPLATPAIAEGKVFVGGGFGSHEFYAFDAATGAHLWTYRTGDDGPTAAVVEDGRIVFNTESCELEVITTSGKPVWKKWLGDPLMSMPAVANGVIYMAYPDSKGDHQYYLAAFDLKNGNTLWKHPIANEVITAPIVEGDRVYATTLDGAMVALNRANGSLIWQDQKNATSAPAVWKDQVFFSRREEIAFQSGPNVAAQKNELLGVRSTAAKSEVKDLPETRQKADYLDYAKNQQTAAGKVSESMDASVGFAGPAKGSAKMAAAQTNLGKATVHGIWSYQGSKSFIDQGRLYSSMGDNARSVEPATGKVVWTRKLHPGKSEAESMLTPPAIVNGKLFIASGAGEVFALAEKTGDVIWKTEIGQPVSFQTAIVGGRIYVGTNQGTLFCLNTGDSRDHGWYMWGANGAHNGSATK
jgi:Ca-activated chloride channel family protein